MADSNKINVCVLISAHVWFVAPQNCWRHHKVHVTHVHLFAGLLILNVSQV